VSSNQKAAVVRFYSPIAIGDRRHRRIPAAFGLVRFGHIDGRSETVSQRRGTHEDSLSLQVAQRYGYVESATDRLEQKLHAAIVAKGLSRAKRLAGG
jgi:hypothetical protein